MPATPWDDGYQNSAIADDSYETDPFADPFGDRQRQPVSSGRANRTVFGPAAPGSAANVFDDPPQQRNATPLFELENDENALAGFQEDQAEQPPSEIPKLPPEDPPFSELAPSVDQPLEDLMEEAPADELPPPLQPTEPESQQPTTEPPADERPGMDLFEPSEPPSLDSPFEPRDTPTVPDEEPSDNLEDLDLFRDDAQPEMPPGPEAQPPQTDRQLPEPPSPEEIIPEPQPEPDLDLDRQRPREDMFEEPPALEAQPVPDEELELEPDRQRDETLDELPRLDLDELPEDDLDRDLYDEDDEEEDEDAIPCDRDYNDRNCCREDRECLAVLDRIERRTIDTISLDITPPFVVQDETNKDEDPEVLKTKKLAEAPSRTWYNREGEVVATGYLQDLSNRGVIVRNDEGDLTTIRFIDLSRDDICFVTAYWNLPAECPLPGDTYAIRDFTMLTYTWTASGQCHKPLYFENVALERYGHSAGPVKQQIWSAAHFFGSAIILPYSMGLYPPNECRYALGYYEPGDCAPWMIHAFPLSKRAALAELSFILAFWGVVQ